MLSHLKVKWWSQWATRHLSSTTLPSSPALSPWVSTAGPSRSLSDDASGSGRKCRETGSPTSAEEVMAGNQLYPPELQPYPSEVLTVQVDDTPKDNGNNLIFVL